MGLDVVELIMRAEEEFEIEIPYEDAELLSTPGQLCALIERKLGFIEAEKRSGCPTSRAFYRVREALRELNVPRSAITPRTHFESLFPAPERAAHWRELERRLDLPLPRLRLPTPLQFALGFPIALLPLWIIWPNVPLFGVVLMSWLALFRFSRRYAFVSTPTGYDTLGNIAHRFAERQHERDPQLESRELWPKVKLMIADEMSLPLEKVTRDADFFRDLGMG